MSFLIHLFLISSFFEEQMKKRMRTDGKRRSGPTTEESLPNGDGRTGPCKAAKNVSPTLNRAGEQTAPRWAEDSPAGNGKSIMAGADESDCIGTKKGHDLRRGLKLAILFIIRLSQGCRKGQCQC